MSLTIAEHSIERVHIIDDDPFARESFGEVVEDLNLEAILANNNYHLYSRGEVHFCAGTIVIDTETSQIHPTYEQHQAFIVSYAPTAMCQS